MRAVASTPNTAPSIPARRRRVLRNARRLLAALSFDDAMAMTDVEVEAACIALCASLTLPLEAHKASNGSGFAPKPLAREIAGEERGTATER
jgi:hypothetical protein